MAPPQQLFILSPPNSGTTAMVRLLTQSPLFWTVTPNGEGQKLPALQRLMRDDPWNADHVYDWARIKAVWETNRPPGRVMLEKSPPNLLRVTEILQTWPDSLFIVSNRNPYAILARRLQKEKSSPRGELIAAAMQDWATRSAAQIANIEKLKDRALVTSYEKFCASPGRFLDKLTPWFGDLRIDAGADILVKSYPPARINDHNAMQIATLSEEDIAEASHRLARRRDLMGFWGYELLAS